MKKDFKTKNKGFTLIELLAVIVILAVIALIAVPQILNILNRARKSAAEDSTSGIAKSAETFVTNFMLQNSGDFPDGEVMFNCISSGCSLSSVLDEYNTDNLTELDFKGTKPTSGTVTITDNGKKVTASNLQVNGFTCIYDGEKSTCGDYKDRVILKEDFAERGIVGGYEDLLAIVYLDPTDLTKECNEKNSVSTAGTNTGCMKWYAYKDEDGKYIMIADHNITGTVAWTSESNNYNGPTELLEALREATTETATWSDKLVEPGSYTASWIYNGQPHEYKIDYSKYGNRARLIGADEIAEITGASKSVDEDGIGWTFQNGDWFFLGGTGSKWQTKVGSSSQKDKHAWLFDNTNNCLKDGCNEEQSGAVGYWTSSAYASSPSHMWFVGSRAGGGLSRDVNDSGNYGVRPVIIVKKSDLLQ